MEKETGKAVEMTAGEKTVLSGLNADKKDLRKRVRQIRDAAPAEERARADRKIMDLLLSLDDFHSASWIYTYVSFGSEPDTRELIHYCLDIGKRVSVPRIEKKEMNFYRIRSWDDLVPGIWGIPEPKEGTEPAEEPGFMLVPGLAFDRKGFRLGYGGGYYDRYLAGHEGFSTTGTSYASQLVDYLPVDQYDRPVDRIITENGIIIPYQQS